MKIFKKPLFLRGSILLALVLALLCIGAVELIVCSYQAPELYQKITTPIRTGVLRLSQAGQATWSAWQADARAAVHSTANRLKDSLEQLTAISELGEDQDEIQLVDDTAVTPPPRSRASFMVTSLAARNGKEYLIGGTREIVYYNQTAPRWADESYGTDKIGGYGCGPTAMAMAVSSLTDTDIDPAQMAQHCVDQGYWAKKHGSYHSIVPGVAEDFGLVCTPLPPDETDEDSIFRHLSNGSLIVALMGPGHFTSRGHFILLRGVTLDGSILVADPASPERSLITWDLNLILDELSANRSSGGPMWLLSQEFF